MTAADRFFALHDRSRTFVLPNCWDAASARIFEEQGFEAIATSSAGVANALGYADLGAIDVEAFFGALERIVRTVRVPVSADMEAGYAATAAGIAANVERAIGLGVVGMNFEDVDPETSALVALDEQCARVRAIKARADALGVRFYLNARCDILLNAYGDEATRVERTIERLRAYVAAGADGAFAPGVSDIDDIRTIAAAVDAPLNVLAGPALPPVSELRAAGVARVSVGSWPMRRTLGVLRGIARELRDRGTYDFVREETVGYAELNALFLSR